MRVVEMDTAGGGRRERYLERDKVEKDTGQRVEGMEQDGEREVWRNSCRIRASLQLLARVAASYTLRNAPHPPPPTRLALFPLS